MARGPPEWARLENKIAASQPGGQKATTGPVVTPILSEHTTEPAGEQIDFSLVRVGFL